MILTSPMPFREALQRNAVRAIMPTNMSTAELQELNRSILERSFFSARNTMTDVLEKAKAGVEGLVSGETDQATVRLELKKILAELDYRPEGEEGTIKDLSSDRRIDLVIETNTEIAQGYGHWRQGQDEEVLDAWPAQELFRAESREQERDWVQRWRLAGGRVTSDGRMIALKNDAVWDLLGDTSLFPDGLGAPYPPFAFGSGMDVRDVSREEAVELGLIGAETRIEPVLKEF